MTEIFLDALIDTLKIIPFLYLVYLLIAYTEHSHADKLSAALRKLGPFGSVGGALLGSHLSTIDPKMFNFLLTFNVLMFVVAGGLGSLTGSLLGATIVTILLEWLRAIEEPMDFGVFEIPGIPGMRMVVFSLILLAIILFRREGIMGTREITWKSIFSLGRRKA